MITIRRSQERGEATFNWLHSFHTFSFGRYFDPAHMGFGALRVINEDRVIPGEGFATHSHSDMEIVTFVLSGELEHRDSLGNGSIIRPGDIQRMTAGTGISHSEYNPSKTESVHLLQIWIEPAQEGLEPSYEQQLIPLDESLVLIGSQDGREGSVTIHQDVSLYAGKLSAGESLRYASPTATMPRRVWLQVTQGSLELNGEVLNAGDGVAVFPFESLEIKGLADPSQFLLFDLAR